jgi:hypothetical protein
MGEVDDVPRVHEPIDHIEHHDDTVGAMQIDPGIVFHLNLLSVVSQRHASMT